MMPDVATSDRWTRDRVFGAAWAYDLAFAWDIGSEVDMALRLAGLDAGPKRAGGPRILMPACGTGRYALAMAERGLVVEASDINPDMLAFGREHRSHPSVTYSQADMTRPYAVTSPRCAAAFTFCNSFRYVLDDADVASHFAAVRARLEDGGAYLIELGLNLAADPIGSQARWRVRHPDCVVTATWTLIEMAPPWSVERAEIRVEHTSGGAVDFADDQPQRVWSRDELVAHAARADLDLRGIYLADGTVAPDASRPGRYYAVFERPHGSKG